MYRRLALLAVGVAMPAFAACQGQQFPTVPVEGVVLKNGKPMDNMKVEFYPDRESGVIGPRSFGVTDAHGRFRLQTDAGADGAVVGKHRVVLVDVEYMERTVPLPPNHPITLKHKGKGPPVKRMSDDYGDYFHTPLRSEATPPSSTVTIEVK
jgi:hypothetical protein